MHLSISATIYLIHVIIKYIITYLLLLLLGKGLLLLLLMKLVLLWLSLHHSWSDRALLYGDVANTGLVRHHLHCALLHNPSL